MPPFNLSKLPRADGKTAVVTGANSGLGFHTARGLAERGAHVVMACRNLDKAAAAKTQLEAGVPGGSFEVMEIDTSSLASVRAFADAFSRKHDALDYLVNNAGIATTEHAYTDAGFELQFATNYLGHFALAGHLLERLEAAGGARVISLSSLAHKWGEIHFDDLQLHRSESIAGGYAQSKLACLMFAYELDRRLRGTDSAVVSLAVHPGVSVTNISSGMPWYMGVVTAISGFVGQSPASAAEPTLMAALHPNVRGGQYLGPGGWRGYRGAPEAVPSSPASRDESAAAKLWTASEALTATHYPGAGATTRAAG